MRWLLERAAPALVRPASTCDNDGRLLFGGPASGCRMPASASSRPITDSPWLWAYLFGMAALASLLLIAPKYSRRQAQLERQYEGRQRAWQSPTPEVVREQPPPVGDADGLIIPLRPLLWLVGGLTLAAWVMHWLTRRRSQPLQPPPPEVAAAPLPAPPTPQKRENELPS